MRIESPAERCGSLQGLGGKVILRFGGSNLRAISDLEVVEEMNTLQFLFPQHLNRGNFPILPLQIPFELAQLLRQNYFYVFSKP